MSRDNSQFSTISSYLTANTAEYQRCYERYYGLENSPSILESRSPLTLVTSRSRGYNQTSGRSNYNLYKVVIDTLCSNVAQNRVRPFFSTVEGSFATVKAVRSLQRYFDVWMDYQKLPNKLIEVFRRSCIFSNAAIWYDQHTDTLLPLSPWQFGIDPTEYEFDAVRTGMVKVNQLPTSLARYYVNPDTKDKTELYNLNTLVVEYYDGHSHYILNGTLQFRYDIKEVPIIPYMFTESVNGYRSVSVISELDGLSEQLEELLDKVKESFQLMPENLIFVPRGSNIKATALAGSRGGKLVQYDPLSTGSDPIHNVVFDPIADSYLKLIEETITRAHNKMGVSPFWTQGKNPLGANASGTALRSMESAQSDRFNQQLASYIDLYPRVTKTVIYNHVTDRQKNSIDWQSVVSYLDSLRIQFSSANIFSKDPSEKLKEIMQLTQTGIIPQYKVPQYLEDPDLQSAYTISMGKTYAVEQYIEDVMGNPQLLQQNIPDALDRNVLESEVIRLLNMFIANGKLNTPEYNLLNQLWDATTLDMQQNGILPAPAAPMGELNVAQPSGLAMASGTLQDVNVPGPGAASMSPPPISVNRVQKTVSVPLTPWSNDMLKVLIVALKAAYKEFQQERAKEKVRRQWLSVHLDYKLLLDTLHLVANHDDLEVTLSLAAGESIRIRNINGEPVREITEENTRYELTDR